MGFIYPNNNCQEKCGSKENVVPIGITFNIFWNHILYQIWNHKKSYKYNLESQLNKKEMESQLLFIYINGIVIVIFSQNHKIIICNFQNHKKFKFK